ncbi:unnamed protein product [Owenia fusiformis]|uniref:Uncharacterized protein n=1 Tax=Owenia fusiformis TaxID=6347 RepID=A0A8J1TFV6_OWEFU|nr:unnamed protein product [Owenia fusiformis]
MYEHADKTQGHICGHSVAVLSTHQTLKEMEFERGIWSFVLDGEIDKIKDYFFKGGDPNLKDSSGYAPLHYSCRSGNADITQLLLENGADVNCRTRSGGVTPLHRACMRGHVDVAKILMKYNANISVQDNDGKTCLNKTVENGHLDVIKIFLSHPQFKDIIQYKDNKGRTLKDYGENLDDSKKQKLLELLYISVDTGS